jgi:hypothetical protein
MEKLDIINTEFGSTTVHKKREYLDSLKTSNRVITYQDVLSAEVFEDGIAVTKTVRSSQIGGALVGGFAFGGVGAIVGGLSGKTRTSTQKIQRVALRLIINDTAEPLHEVTFLDTETKKDGILYKTAMEKARHWHGLMEVVIKRADIYDKESNAGPQTIIATAQPSIADELKKFADLRDIGVLSVEEFQQQKRRLLGSGEQFE